MKVVHRNCYRLFSFSFVLVYLFSSKKFIIDVLLFFIIFLLILEWVRFKNKIFNEKIFNLFSSYLREREKTTISSTTIFFISMIITIILFKKEIAIVSLSFLIFADSTSAIFGYYFGKKPILTDKTLEGSIVFFLTCITIGTIFKSLGFSLNWLVIFASSLSASVVELFSYIDDNISVPIVSGLVISLLS